MEKKRTFVWVKMQIKIPLPLLLYLKRAAAEEGKTMSAFCRSVLSHEAFYPGTPRAPRRARGLRVIRRTPPRPVAPRRAAKAERDRGILARIREAIAERKEIAAPEMVALSGLPSATFYQRIYPRLAGEGIVRVSLSVTAGRTAGRPPLRFSLPEKETVEEIRLSEKETSEGAEEGRPWASH